MLSNHPWQAPAPARSSSPEKPGQAYPAPHQPWPPRLCRASKPERMKQYRDRSERTVLPHRCRECASDHPGPPEPQMRAAADWEPRQVVRLPARKLRLVALQPRQRRRPPLRRHLVHKHFRGPQALPRRGLEVPPAPALQQAGEAAVHNRRCRPINAEHRDRLSRPRRPSRHPLPGSALARSSSHARDARVDPTCPQRRAHPQTSIRQAGHMKKNQAR